MNESMKSNKLQVLLFLLQEVRVGVLLKDVKKVLPFVQLEMIPGSPFYFAGLMNVGGNSIPVIDLAMRLGLTRNKNYTLNMPILLCSNGKHQVGMIVDSVIEMINMDESELQTHDEFKDADSPFLGSLVYHSELSLLLNLNQVLNVNFSNDIPVNSINTYLTNRVDKTP